VVCICSSWPNNSPSWFFLVANHGSFSLTLILDLIWFGINYQFFEHFCYFRNHLNEANMDFALSAQVNFTFTLFGISFSCINDLNTGSLFTTGCLTSLLRYLSRATHLLPMTCEAKKYVKKLLLGKCCIFLATQAQGVRFNIRQAHPEFLLSHHTRYFKVIPPSISFQTDCRYCFWFPHTAVLSKQATVMVSHSHLLLVLAPTLDPIQFSPKVLVPISINKQFSLDSFLDCGKVITGFSPLV